LGWRSAVTPSEDQIRIAEALAGYGAVVLENARSHADAERRQTVAQALAELVREGAAEYDIERAITLVCERGRHLLRADYAGISLLEDGRRIWHGLSGNQTETWQITTRGRGDGVTSQAMAGGRTVVLEDLDTDPDRSLIHSREGGRTAIATPLRGRDGFIGALHFGWRRNVTLGTGRLSLAEAVASYAAVIVENARAHASLEDQALHDSLTGLPNRRLFEDRLQQALLAARRDNLWIAVMVMDLDRFKEVNDTLGHQAGDQLLHDLGARLVAPLRSSDTVARLGGDEFAILLTRLDDPGGAAVAGRKVLDAVDQPMTIKDQRLRVAASIGVALYPRDAEDMETLLRRADLAMYSAKRSGGGLAEYGSYMETVSAKQTLLQTA
jgi:diguanylate cyclase (GGDEF)-like protein